MNKTHRQMKIERTLGDGMTVEDLMTELQGLPKAARVVFACDYGDHCHTQQALPVKSIDVYSVNVVRESGYSSSGLAIETDEIDDDDEVIDTDVIDDGEIVVLR